MNVSVIAVVRLISVCLLLSILSGCSLGGNVSSRPNAEDTSPIVQIPTITSPFTQKFYSNGSSLNISGMCMSGDIVQLLGDSKAQQLCIDSSYSFTVSEFNDGIYVFQVSQVDSANNTSPSATMTWIRQTSIPPPTIIQPATTPFASALSSLTISGGCESDATVTLSGDATASTTCENAQFNFTVPKTVDGDYSIQVSQTDPSGNTASSSVVWQKHALIATPPNPTITVNTAQIFGYTGGSGVYSLSILVNLSGGTLDEATNTYTTGLLANVTDTLLLTDSLGSSLPINVSTVAAAPDHLVPVLGNNQTETIGSSLPLQLEARVVDQYNNGIANFQLYFDVIDGDSVIAAPIQTSDSTGLVKATLALGQNNLVDQIVVRPLSGILPDLALSGNATLKFGELAKVASSASGSFGLNFVANSNPGALVLANFGASHHDNTHRDIAVVNQSGSNISVLLNTGAGLYSNSNYSVCPGPVALATGDFNGDSVIDIAVVCSSGFVNVLFGNYDGSFQTPASSFVTNPGPTGIVVADFNADTHLDLAVASSVNGQVGIHFGNGTGGFGNITEITNTTGMSPSGLVAADINKDGAPDLIVQNSSSANTISVLINQNNGTGTFAPNVDFATGLGLAAIAVGDFNRDGYPDIAVANSADNDLGVFLNNGSGSLTAMQVVSIESNAEPAALIAGDFQSAGYNQDLAVADNGTSDIAVLINTTTTGSTSVNFNSALIYPQQVAPIAIAANNTNGDAVIDLVFSEPNSPATVSLLNGHGNGVFGNAVSVGSNLTGVLAGHFINTDVNMDTVILSSSANSATIYKSLGNNMFSLVTTLTTGSGPVAGVIGDFNRDGSMDLAVLNKSAKTVSVFLGNGSGGFSAKKDYPTGNAPTAIATQDINNDGALDLIVTNSADSTVSILLGDSNLDGGFQAKVDHASGHNPQSVVTGDFNGDGFIDLAMTAQDDNAVSILLGNGDATFQPIQQYAVGNQPGTLVTADFLGNSPADPLDLAVVNVGDGTVTILQGVGNGFFTTKSQTYMGGVSLGGLAVGDFYGTGVLDLIVPNGDNSFAVAKGHGNGNFDTPVAIFSNNSGAVFSSINAADYNGDGILDVIVIDASGGDFEFWPGH